ncbi:type III PLP-dependent enzyme [Brytella acorum]|uniref:ornithine decarboxylase n=1 Tax=Brytella acorum TaxID=2959299 RepID=A0AA35XWI6_9PROT|nr:type III PLP-dependent enzyme [Brytella acorum]MDF3623997.1 type III PLP-dependent enzyme [Brytella acorum]CAI9120900.1 type III PLP-dependent enzyme [Brytella acorum]
MTPKIARYLAEQQPATPCLVVDVDHVAARYAALSDALPLAHIYYAVKANPAPQILERLVSLGSSFDAASIGEIRQCVAAGATPDRISFGNTVKKVSSIREAFALGIDLFVFDSVEELYKLADHAPGARVFCRLAVENAGADWPLSRKFGTTLKHAHELMLMARDLGLDPYGLSFHVGSQQTQTDAYEAAIARVAMLHTDLKNDGIDVRMVNLGGGFPVRYNSDVPDIDDFGLAIGQAMTRHFGNDLPQMLVEPGRYLVAEAGVVSTEVVLVSRRGGKETDPRWVYLDIGRFSGLAETEGEAIRYTFRTDHDGEPTGETIVAGPSCDGVDIMYEKRRVELPLALKSGERIELLTTGAYVSTYCSTGFNGFAPLSEHYI